MSHRAPKRDVVGVQIDGLAMLKVIKHCHENGSSVVTGQLLGLDVDGKVEITNCFPLLQTDVNKYDIQNDVYQVEMMKLLRTVNVDHNSVGWYQSAYMGEFINLSIVANQFEYQKEIPSSVVLVYDPFRTTSGCLAMKAFRLTREFFQFYKNKDFSHINFAKMALDSTGMFEEIPIKVHNSHLIHGFLFELQAQSKDECEFDRLRLDSANSLIKSMGILGKCVDSIGQDQNKFLFQQRQKNRLKAQRDAILQKLHDENDSRRNTGEELLDVEEEAAKNPLFKPIVHSSRLETYLTNHKMGFYVEQSASEAGQSLNKLYVMDALAQEK